MDMDYFRLLQMENKSSYYLRARLMQQGSKKPGGSNQGGEEGVSTQGHGPYMDSSCRPRSILGIGWIKSQTTPGKAKPTE